MIHVLGQEIVFPDPRKLKFEPEPGLVAIGGDFSVERLALAYRNGIFPWTDDPITWWSPNPRAIFEFEKFHVPRSLHREIKRSVILSPGESLGTHSEAQYEITIDRAFPEVIRHCATSRKKGNWITKHFVQSYIRFHQAGHAHSLEVWQKEKLVGGIYGVAIGGFFAGESMFHLVSNMSKLALYFLFQHLKERGFTLFDTQVLTPTTVQFGASEIPREEYLARLEKAVNQPISFR
ncbi:MAG: leucyl/phenylalanyl-tRNA--protein transferase [Limisphaerales bacterium]